MTEYVDWQKKLSDDFDVDGYMMPNETAKDFHDKFRAAELRGRVAGMREAARMAFLFMGCVGETTAHSKQRGDMVAHITVAATKLESPNPTECGTALPVNLKGET